MCVEEILGDACVDAGRILSRQTDPDADTQLTALEACLTACRACAAECERRARLVRALDLADELVDVVAGARLGSVVRWHWS